jgi:hypothetical protein
MSTTETSDRELPRAPTRVENSTDATRGEPLAVRAQKRKAELEAALEKLPVHDLRARNDIALALGTVEGLLTGDLENLSHATGSALSRWLENSKHLAETTPAPIQSEPAPLPVAPPDLM